MAKTKELKSKIVEQLEGLTPDQLRTVLGVLKKLKPEESKKDRVLAYAGIWKNMDGDLVDDLTKGLHQRRAQQSSRKDLR